MVEIQRPASTGSSERSEARSNARRRPALVANARQSEFEALVERTAGPRPWRRLVHALNGLTIAAVLAFVPLTRDQAVTALTTILLALVVLDAVRLRSTSANRLFFRTFAPLLSPREAGHVASSTWYTLGVLLVVALFPRPFAVSATLVLALADPAASWIGRRWGVRRFLGGTVAGSAAFFLVALLVLGPRHGPVTAAVVAAAATLAERRAWPLDDNLAVPVVCATLLAVLEALS